MYKLTLDREVTHSRLIRELAALGLPGFKGAAVLTRETDDAGRAVLDKNRRPLPKPRYLLLKTAALDASHKTAISKAIQAHAADKEPTKLELLRTEKSDIFETEMVDRIATQVPEWDTIDIIKVAVGIMRGGDQTLLTPKQKISRAIFTYARETAPAKLAALTTTAELDAVIPKAADPFGDGDGWPV